MVFAHNQLVLNCFLLGTIVTCKEDKIKIS